MKKSLRITIWVILGLFASLGAVAVVFVTMFDGSEIILRGSLETKVKRAFFQTYNITSVKVYRLGEMSDEVAGDSFPIMPYKSFAKIVGTTELSGDELTKFIELWRGMSPNYNYQALCHEPVFAVEFFESDRRVFRTSICWHCSNFYVEIFPGIAAWYGFDSGSKDGQAVLKYFKDKIPTE
jgi:hypothetical protein